MRDQHDPDLTRPAGAATPGGPSSAVGGWSRFPPGAVLAGRFRIVAPLGRGGMGEVYRADDLRLEQPVALKFLTEAVAADPARLSQFHNEVRVARTIAHRHVCRTYDIGDADGRPFLTMEYVDGEDLASLLHRIGRFPQDRAIDVARQICAGVSAAHERGVLHRDLKPANIMIDGDGQVRITDFGLAAVAGGADPIHAGTPAYMAPEQLAGREATVRSDIYALGLVLFELFTGRRAFEAATLNELRRAHESTSVATPSSIVRDLDPAIERTILRCLDPAPARRPPSALAVAAALPGGDPLAAAVAAGETPSPEMVAAAGVRSALPPALGLALVAFTVMILAALAAISQRFAVVHRVPMPKSIDALTDRAQELLERLGYGEAPFDTARGWALDRAYFRYAAGRGDVDPAAALGTGRTGTLTFWYRTSPTARAAGDEPAAVDRSAVLAGGPDRMDAPARRPRPRSARRCCGRDDWRAAAGDARRRAAPAWMERALPAAASEHAAARTAVRSGADVDHRPASLHQRAADDVHHRLLSGARSPCVAGDDAERDPAGADRDERVGSAEHLPFDVAIALAGIALVFAVLVRFGLLALIVTFYTFLALWEFPMTIDFSRPYAASSAVILLCFAALSACAFWLSRGGEPLFGRAIFD